MASPDEYQVLVTSVGEYTLSVLDRDLLNGLRITLDKHGMNCHVTIALDHNTDANQKTMIASMLEVEEIYFDELIMSFSFVSSLDDEDAPRASVPQYVHA